MKHRIFLPTIVLVLSLIAGANAEELSERDQALVDAETAIVVGDLAAAQSAANRAHELGKSVETIKLRADLEITELELSEAKKLFIGGQTTRARGILDRGLASERAGLYLPLSQRFDDYELMLQTADRSFATKTVDAAEESLHNAAALLETDAVKLRMKRIAEHREALARGDTARAAGKLEEASKAYEEAAAALVLEPQDLEAAPPTVPPVTAGPPVTAATPATPAPPATPPSATPPAPGAPVAPASPTGNYVPRESVSAANAIFEDANKLRKSMNVFQIKENNEKALSRFEEIIRTWPNCDKVPDSYYYAAFVLDTLDRPRKSIEYFETAVRLGCSDPVDAYIEAADVAEDDLDDKKLAREYLNKALAICTDSRVEKIHKQMRDLD